MNDGTTYILHLSYDGTRYYGWQKQPNVPTIQGILETALRKIFSLSGDLKTTGASRTDKGVHAEDQVVSFSAQEKFRPDDLARRLNKMLPNDIAVVSAECTDERFNARFNAKSKVYQYLILLKKMPMKIQYGWWLKSCKVDVKDALPMLNELSAMVVGEHNFSAFAVQQDLPDDASCRIFNAIWRAPCEAELEFSIEGNRFLHKMVRSLVGAMLDTIRGRIDAKSFELMLNTGNRVCEYRTAPPEGLTLIKVNY